MKVSDEQLGVIIANKIKENGLNGVFDTFSIDNIKEKLKAEFRKMRTSPTEVIPEGQFSTSSAVGNTFPYDADDVQPDEVDATMDITPALEAGAEPTDVAYAPAVYTPELPDVLKNVEPAKLVVMELNDIIENGENLANKPFRMMDDINMEQSMKALWNSDGATKAEVYQIKYERIGDMVFDYANGTATYTSTPSPSEHNIDPNGEYKDNPYAGPSAVDGVVSPTAQDIEAYVKTSVNIEDIVKKTVIDLMARAHEEQASLESKIDLGLAPAVEPDAPDAKYGIFQP